MRYSRTHRPWKTVRFASYQCRFKLSYVSRSHPRLYRPYQFMISHYPCCGKFICKGCVQSFCKSGNQGNCSFCKSERLNQITGYHTDEERIEELMNRIEKNDASALCEMSRIYYSGLRGVQQDRVKAMELLKKAAELGSSESHFSLGSLYDQGGYLKKAKFHYEAVALVGCEAARFHLGIMVG